MNILLIGPPAVGKGTQAAKISDLMGLKHLSTGDVLREASNKGTEEAKRIVEILALGKYVPDDLVCSLVKQAMMESNRGVVFDGFPRTVDQAHFLEREKIEIDYVIELCLSDQLVEERISGRSVHMPSGRVYHNQFNPPKEQGIDDVTGEPLAIRDDDKVDVVRSRLKIYHQMTKPLLDLYSQESRSGKFHQVDASLPIDTVFSNICDHLSS
mgnify:CR=1 FL=1